MTLIVPLLARIIHEMWWTRKDTVFSLIPACRQAGSLRSEELALFIIRDTLYEYRASKAAQTLCPSGIQENL